ncbi:MAG: adenylate/guanylate cyclase domain-containing protein, partial [Gaiellaceae bacterium]
MTISRLPSGSLALVFTDVERSTQLASRLGERWPEVLATYRRLVRTSFEPYGGVEVDVAGDGFFFVFPEPHAAAAAAAAAEACEREISGNPWPSGGDVRVRIGIHCATLAPTQEGYAGLEVHKAARIGSAAHGGQVLLSQETRDVLGDRVVSDLGEFRLKDLTAAERLFQLEIDGLASSFPAPRSLNATNLPVQPLPLIGRQHEVATVLELLRGGARLVTLTGPGGIGKTRLALEVAAELAHDFEDAVYWVPLATIDEPQRVPDLIAAMLGAPIENDGLLRFLRHRKVLLVADNFEHVVDAVPVIAELLAGAPHLQIVATSRSLLHLSAERELLVAALHELDAAELFTARAQAVLPGFEASETTLAICRKLECIPLALELAAARLRHFGEETLLRRLDRSLDVLIGGPTDLPERQQTLRGVVVWSYELLAPEERRLLDRLSVFAGRASLELIEQVCGDGGDILPGVSSLVDKNLLRWFAPPGELEHYFMLEAVREFALEQLAADGDEIEIRRRHRDAFLQLAESLDPVRRMAGIQALVPERNNVRAALRWSLDTEPAAEETLRLAYILWRYWLETGSVSEGWAWLEEAIAATSGLGGRLQAQALDAASLLAAQKGDFPTALELNERSQAVAEETGVDGALLGWILARRGQIDIDRGALAEAAEVLIRAGEILRRERQLNAEAWTLIELGRTMLLRGDAAAAAEQFSDAVEAARSDDAAAAGAYARVLLGVARSFSGGAETGVAEIEAGLDQLRALAANFTLT